MANVTIHNPELDAPIDTVVDGRHIEIHGGETREVPASVAENLLVRYGFLQVVSETVQPAEPAIGGQEGSVPAPQAPDATETASKTSAKGKKAAKTAKPAKPAKVAKKSSRRVAGMSGPSKVKDYDPSRDSEISDEGSSVSQGSSPTPEEPEE